MKTKLREASDKKETADGPGEPPLELIHWVIGSLIH
jgi:hypothetical protein